jgi:hypothetical protein
MLFKDCFFIDFFVFTNSFFFIFNLMKFFFSLKDVNNMSTYEHTIKIKLKNEEKQAQRDKLPASSQSPSTKNSTNSYNNNNNNNSNPSTWTKSTHFHSTHLPPLTKPTSTTTTGPLAIETNLDRDESALNLKLASSKHRHLDEDDDYYQKNDQYLINNDLNLRDLKASTAAGVSLIKETSTSKIPCINSTINENYLLNDNDNQTLSGSNTNRSDQTSSDFRADLHGRSNRLSPLNWHPRVPKENGHVNKRPQEAKDEEEEEDDEEVVVNVSKRSRDHRQMSRKNMI